MATYYASKNYVLKLTEAISQELKEKGSNVYIGALCPGPVDTEFNDIAKVKFNVKAMNSNEVASYAIDKMFNGKNVIVPGFKMKVLSVLYRFVPTKLLLKINYNVQKKKDV